MSILNVENVKTILYFLQGMEVAKEKRQGSFLYVENKPYLCIEVMPKECHFNATKVLQEVEIFRVLFVCFKTSRQKHEMKNTNNLIIRLLVF